MPTRKQVSRNDKELIFGNKKSHYASITTPFSGKLLIYEIDLIVRYSNNMATVLISEMISCHLMMMMRSNDTKGIQ